MIAIAIKLDTRGPVIFRQQRLRGRRVLDNGELRWELRPFTLYKLRTMVVGADTSAHQVYMAAYIEGDDNALRSEPPRPQTR